MTYVIATIKRLGNNAMVVVDATDQNSLQYYVIDDHTELSEKQLYQINAVIANDEMTYSMLETHLQELSDDKYKVLYDEAVRKGFITKSEKVVKVVKKEPIQEAEVIEYKPVNVDSTGNISNSSNIVVDDTYNSSSAIVPQRDNELTSPSGLPSMSDVDEYFKRYEYVKKTAISPSDYHEYFQGGKKRTFLKKSGFRKFIHAFGLTIKIIKTQNRLYPHNQNGKIIQGIEYEVMARAIAPNGQSTENVAICQQYEKGGNRTKHDVLTTATTRAINRAISDLVAFGEVSYEEL